jgi:predicted transposase YdaD
MKARLTTEKVLEDAGWLARWEANGEARGKERMALEIAHNALAEELPIEVIQKITGLPIETISSLQ